MKLELSTLDIKTLKKIYQKQVDELNDNLLKGATWKEVADQRKHIVEISMAIDKIQQHRLIRKLPNKNNHLENPD